MPARRARCQHAAASTAGGAAITIPFPQPIGVVLVPRFTLLALASTTEPLRIANRYAEHPYDWRLYSLDGRPVPDRNGLPIAVAGALADAGELGTVIVIADVGPPRAVADALMQQLRQRARAGAVIGGVDTAPLLLARAGLLDGHRATAHWEVLAAFRERYPRVQVTEHLTEIDRKRVTCAGGTAALDLMLADMQARLGRQLALRVGECCLAGRAPRRADEAQRPAPVRSGSRKLQQAIALMDPETGRPSDVEHVARALGLSGRQFNRLFTRELGIGPSRFRLQLRLEHAHQLLAQGDVSVAEAVAAAGFRSRSYFSRAYRARFGHPPRDDRR